MCLSWEFLLVVERDLQVLSRLSLAYIYSHKCIFYSLKWYQKLNCYVIELCAYPASINIILWFS